MNTSLIRRRTIVSSFACLVLFTGLASAQSTAATSVAGQAQKTLQKVMLTINGNDLITEIANTPDQRYMGLSFREALGENEAMLFVYPETRMLTFTMRNTLLPLSIAYISKDFVITEIHDMPVGPDQLFPSAEPAKFALEVNQGWFEKNGIEAGTKISMSQ